jgi:hypothetical protein
MICAAWVRTQARLTRVGRQVTGCQGRGEHRRDAVGAQHGVGLSAPGAALFGQGTGFVFGLPGLEVGLLRQRPGLHHGGGPVMLALKRGRQLGLAVFDRCPALGPAGVQHRVDPDEFAYRALARIGGGGVGEPHRQGLRETPFERGVVDLRGGHDGLEQQPPVDRQPSALEGLHLVRHRHMGMQIRVARAAVAMREPGSDQPSHIHLADAVVAGPRVQGVGLDEPQRVPDRGQVRPLNHRRRRRVSQRPQRRHALHRRERQVIAGDRRGPRTRHFRDQTGQLTGVDRVASIGCPKRLPAHLRTDRSADLRRDRRLLRGAHLRVVGGELLGDLDPEHGHVVRVHLERCAKPDRLLQLSRGRVHQ